MVPSCGSVLARALRPVSKVAAPTRTRVVLAVRKSRRAIPASSPARKNFAFRLSGGNPPALEAPLSDGLFARPGIPDRRGTTPLAPARFLEGIPASYMISLHTLD
jgi:hypothetical protein